MRHFEFVEGSSSKFWEVAVDGTELTVRYGKIGTAGQTQTKSFATAAKAQAEHDKLVREKTGKGYLEQGVMIGAMLAAVAPKVAAAKSESARTSMVQPALAAVAAQTTESAQPVSDAPTAVAPGRPADGPEPQPPGVFLWTPYWRRQLMPFAGEPMAAVPALDADALFTDLARRAVEGWQASSHMPGGPLRKAASQILAGCAEGQSALRTSPPRRADWSEFFSSLFAFTQIHFGGDQPQLVQGWKVAAALHGLPFGVQMLLEAALDAAGKSGMRLSVWTLSSADLDELRRRIAVATDAEQVQIDIILADLAPRATLLACLCAFLRPEQPALATQAIRALRQSSNAGEAAWLADLRLDADQAAELIDVLDTVQIYQPELLRTLSLNLARLQLPAALPWTLHCVGRGYLPTPLRRQLFEIVRAHDGVAALDALIEHFDDKDARPQLDPFARLWPELALRLAAERLRVKPDKALQDWTLRFASGQPDALAAARDRASAALRGVLDALVARGTTQVVDAPAGALPDWLRAPPWRQRGRSLLDAYRRLTPAGPVESSWHWLPGERERWLDGQTPDSARGDLFYESRQYRVGPPLQRAVLKLVGVVETAHDRALAGGVLTQADLGPSRWRAPAELMQLPLACAAQLLVLVDPRDWSEYGLKMEVAVAWLDRAATPGVERIATRNPVRGLALALPLASAQLAPIAADALRNARKAKPFAQAWLLRHAGLAATTLLPALADPKTCQDASHALRWLLENGRADAVESAAAGYGAEGEATLARLRAFDPMQLAPLKIPKLPSFWDANSGSRPLLRDGAGVLPVAVMDAVAEMLAFSALDARYAGVDRLRALCTPASLGAFAWDLFKAWLAAGASAKEAWAFQALAHLGDDDCARKLALLIRVWPGESAHARAVTGLEILAGIGSDVALMHLNGIAQKLKFKGLQDKARERIQQLAESRGLSAEQLADRLVPDLGLDEQGTLLLDFGPRQFTIGFDETLKPFVRDAGAKPLKDLPKPIRSDDATLADAATERWKALKKDARTLSSQQIVRLELAMSARRRWTPAEFRIFFVEHPLLRHLARRLLWGVYGADDGACRYALRVAEDLSYADRNDDLLVLPEDDGVLVGLVHALELPADDAAAFGQVLADYEVLQPFQQLGRECYVLDAAEAKSHELQRCKDKRVATGSVFGLENRGWRRGQPQDAGWIGWMERPVGDNLVVQLDLDPGTVVGDINYEPKQKLGALELRRADSWGKDGLQPWSRLDPVLVSEVLRDVARLAEVV